MSSVLTKRKLASVLRSPALAVVAAYGLRMALLWLAHHNEDPANPRFETIGLENNLVAMSLAMSKGFFGPYPGYEAVTAVLAPVYPWMSAIGFKLFHLDYFGGMLFCQTMNSAFSAATCWPIHAVGKKVFGERVGLASALLWGFTALVNPTICILLPFLLAWLMIRRWQAARPSAGLVMRTVFAFLLAL